MWTACPAPRKHSQTTGAERKEDKVRFSPPAARYTSTYGRALLLHVDMKHKRTQTPTIRPQPRTWGLGRSGFAARGTAFCSYRLVSPLTNKDLTRSTNAESTSIWRGAVAHEELTMPTQSIVVTCALDGQSGSHVGSTTHSTGYPEHIERTACGRPPLARRPSLEHAPSAIARRPRRASDTSARERTRTVFAAFLLLHVDVSLRKARLTASERTSGRRQRHHRLGLCSAPALAIYRARSARSTTPVTRAVGEEQGRAWRGIASRWVYAALARATA